MSRSASRDPQSQDLCSASIARGPSLILWDLIGSCNLRCPSCPIGSMPELRQGGVISQDLFHAILDKLDREFPGAQLHFYNWTEPLIHPHINAFCRDAGDRGFRVHLSSNLNVLREPKELAAAGVKTIRISLSGFTQRVYEIGHRGGDIDTVKRNMQRLADAIRVAGSRTKVHVYYHKYRHNVEELEPMESFARSLDFDCISTWAFYMPLENVLAYRNNTLAPSERAFADERIVPNVNSALSLMHPHRENPCEIIDQLVLDHQGNVMLCCAVYDRALNAVGNYLECTWQEIQRARYGHTTCGDCMREAAHVLFTYFDKPDLRHEIERCADLDYAQRPAAFTGGTISLPVLNESDSSPLTCTGS